jgi:hypothetical protein
MTIRWSTERTGDEDDAGIFAFERKLPGRHRVGRAQHQRRARIGNQRRVDGRAGRQRHANVLDEGDVWSTSSRIRIKPTNTIVVGAGGKVENTPCSRAAANLTFANGRKRA